MEDLLLRLVADGASVVEDQARIGLILHLRIALVLERPDHLFGVVRVHLAAEGLDVESLAHIFQYIAGRTSVRRRCRTSKPKRV